MIIETDKNWIMVYNEEKIICVISSQTSVQTMQNHFEADDIAEIDAEIKNLGFDYDLIFDESELNKLDEARLNNFAEFKGVVIFGKSKSEIVTEILEKQKKEQE